MRIADGLHIRGANAALLENFDGSPQTTCARFAVDSALAGAKLDFLNPGQQSGEVILVGSAELTEIVPSARHVGTEVEDHNSLIERMARFVLY